MQNTENQGGKALDLGKLAKKASKLFFCKFVVQRFNFSTNLINFLMLRILKFFYLKSLRKFKITSACKSQDTIKF